MFDTTPIQPDPQWVVPVPLLSDSKLAALCVAVEGDSLTAGLEKLPATPNPPPEWVEKCRKAAKRFARNWPEFGKTAEWYTEELVSMWPDWMEGRAEYSRLS